MARRKREKVVEEYWKGQHMVTNKVTYAELAEKYQIPASTIRGYQSTDPSGTMPVKPAQMGRKCVLEPSDEKLVNYLLQCCDHGYGKNRM